MLKLIVSGRVGGDATAQQVNGQFAIRFSIAHSSHYYDEKGQKVEKTTWVKCTLWKDKDKVSQYIKKGDVLFVEGTPRANAWMDDSRNIKSGLEINVTNFEFVHSAKGQNGNVAAPTQPDQATPSTTATPAPAADPFAGDKTPDDIPF